MANTIFHRGMPRAVGPACRTGLGVPLGKRHLQGVPLGKRHLQGVPLGKRHLLWVLMTLLALWSGGCGRGNRNVPSAGSARQALETALTAWRNGERVGTVASASPPVQAVDSGWGKGQKLTGYEILEEVMRQDGRRCFKVRLHLQQPGKDQEVHYVVIGQSPLWVYREEDYTKAQGWGG